MSNQVSTADRFGVTLLFSLIAHAIVILGVSFTFATPAARLPSLDVILVQSANAQKPEKADFLAQANNAGGGESDQARRPTQQLSSPLPKPTPGLAPKPIEAGAPTPTPPSRTEVLTQRNGDFTVSTEKETPEQRETDLPQAQELAERRIEMAKLAQEVQNRNEAYAKRPKKKFISANTQEYEYASYLAAWAARVTRVGNLNYPDEARRQQLRGNVILTVTLNKDGSVQRMDIIEGSGHKVLDDAVQRIVQLAVPFPPIPKTAEEIDELHITRTWIFGPGDILDSR
ncbi:MAG TPA: energy transducer TonB [Tahibacter sp.]|uniref:Energy transducer TonB n=1 Tax=Tahibacter soli TaxID=2983605 RepID=A0A9X3YGR3_9GAMM|nr:energy transducer TonB [Tahibacter soli]MDC8011374.1 energy transducer TonB [Tahibacter soli]HVJ63426.1 energy transducer TonB [Tahibacter sp.]